jgi:hypothetical protein
MKVNARPERLAIVFYVGFWPWILALVGLTIIIEGIGEYYSKRRNQGK